RKGRRGCPSRRTPRMTPTPPNASSTPRKKSLRDVERAAELLAAAHHGLALTGAGVSAESGIPTFRGEGGLWTKDDPVKVSSIDSCLADPAAYWTVAKERGSVVLNAKPNPGHLALAALESAGHIVAVVTQNTDGLHRDAGSRRVVELHGSGRTVE